MKSVLVICTGNSCRSQMAEGFFRKYKPEWNVFSAGTKPAKEVNPYAVRVMSEEGIDISKQYPKLIDIYTGKNFDYVITVCDNAKETCPVFSGNVKERIHAPFEDPIYTKGTDEEILNVYRNVRDKIKNFVLNFASL